MFHIRVIVFLVVVFLAANVSVAAEAAIHCTRYVGTPSGVFDWDCPSETGYGTISTSQPDSTDATALRDENYVYVPVTVCKPVRLHLFYYNPPDYVHGQKTSDGCGIHSIVQESPSAGYSYSRCKLKNDNGVYVSRQADCTTDWHD